MTTEVRTYALEAVLQVVDNGVPGSVLECGVWRGGRSMVAAVTLMSREARLRAVTTGKRTRQASLKGLRASS